MSEVKLKKIHESFRESLLKLETFNSIEAGEIISLGIIKNQQDELFMTDSRIGENLLWVAVKGRNNDWAIYCDWAEKTKEEVIIHGQKVASKHHVLRLVNCDNNVLDLYRY